MEIIKIGKSILSIRKVYLDISALCNPLVNKYLNKMSVQLCISELTLLELNNCEIYMNEFNKSTITEIVNKAHILKINDAILNLAKRYVEKGIIPREKYSDSLHISIAKYYRCYTILYDRETLKNKELDFNKILLKNA